MTRGARFALNANSYSHIYIQLRITIHLKTLNKFFLRLNLTSCLTLGGMVPRDQCPQTSWYDSRSFQTGKTCFRRLVDSGHCRFRHGYETFAYFRCSALGKKIYLLSGSLSVQVYTHPSQSEHRKSRSMHIKYLSVNRCI